MPEETLAPAYYAAKARGWRRDVWAVLHPPYTAWHLSYVLIGAGLAPLVDGVNLIATLVSFFLAVGEVWDLNNGRLLPDLLREIPEYRADLDDHAPV